MRPTKRTQARPIERRQIRLAALRSWGTAETIDDVSKRLRVRPQWLYQSLRADLATVYRHFGPTVSADDVVRLASLELGLARDRIRPEAARNFVVYAIRRMYAGKRAWEHGRDKRADRRRRKKARDLPSTRPVPQWRESLVEWNARTGVTRGSEASGSHASST